MRKIIPYLFLAIAFSMTTSLKATIVTVMQVDNTFDPQNFSVSVGDTIRWVWTSGLHTTTSADIPAGAAAWDSFLMETVPMFEYVVTVPGTYNYVCTPHVNIGMIGSFTATGTLGIADNISTNSLKIYPNPANSRASLSVVAERTSDASISIYDLLGNQIRRDDITIKQGPNKIELPVTDILPGIYFIELRYDDQSAIVRRFVKSR